MEANINYFKMQFRKKDSQFELLNKIQLKIMHIYYKCDVRYLKQKVMINIKNKWADVSRKIQRNKDSEGSMRAILAIGKVEKVLKERRVI